MSEGRGGKNEKGKKKEREPINQSWTRQELGARNWLCVPMWVIVTHVFQPLSVAS